MSGVSGVGVSGTSMVGLGVSMVGLGVSTVGLGVSTVGIYGLSLIRVQTTRSTNTAWKSTHMTAR